MAKEIKWTKTASRNFDNIMKYLSENWSYSVVSNFVHRTSDILLVLSEFPHLGELQVADKGIRGILITKHNKLFYRIDGPRLIVLKIFDTRQNPKKLKLR